MIKISHSAFSYLSITIVLLTMYCPLYAQVPQTEQVSYWILFSQKNSLMPVQIPAQTLERRDTRGTIAGQSWYDLPVDSGYIESVKGAGAAVRVVSRWLNGVSVKADQSTLSRINALPFVTEIVRVSSYVMPPPILTSPPMAGFAKTAAFDYGPSEQQISMLEIDSLHSAGLSGHDVKIGIMDTGFDTTHQAFRQMTAENRVLATRDFLSGGNDVMGSPNDGQRFHGTAVLSLIGGFDEGNLIGTAFGAEFILAKTESLAIESITEEDDWVAASEWMESLGVDIISSSLGYIDWYDTTQLDGHTAVITIAAGVANQLGVVVVNAAGNEGNNPLWHKVTPPADGDSVIAAGAVDANGLVPSFSSRGPTADGRIKPDFAALGVGDYIAISGGTYSASEGTSFAAPLLAGGIALLLEGHPQWRLVDVITNLKRASSNFNQPNNSIGWGVPNFASALGGLPYHPPPGSTPFLYFVPHPAHNTVNFYITGLISGTASLSVHDISGDKIQEWQISAQSDSVITLVWDGRDRSGNKIASGIYICVLRVGDTDIHQKLAYFSQ
jgi:serine protease AprX